ncbi:MAG: hypothetical protein KF749_16025 [Bacteroidetes bacterium]|nr:hypothetical protein [Bacteroidota bacterium]MCW5894176.1 hypothetical protein [Bacteroidota bacterium]
MTTLRNISFVLLAFAYLTISCGVVLHTITPTYTGSGPASFDTQREPGKDVPKKVVVTRRHLPLVKPCNIPVEVAYPVIVVFDTKEHCIHFRQLNALPEILLVESSLSNRAPPLS